MSKKRAIAKSPRQQESEYVRLVDEWLAAHGITWELFGTGSMNTAAIGWWDKSTPKWAQEVMHDTYSAVFKRTTPAARELKVLAFNQSAAHSRSERERCASSLPVRGGARNCACDVRHGQTVVHSRTCPQNPRQDEAPSTYDILACLTKFDPGAFTDFCSDFGYDTDSRRAERVYFAVQEEWRRVLAFFSTEELAELSEIAS